MKKSLSALALVVLVFAAACTLFKKDIKVPQVFYLEIDQPADAPLQFSVSKEVSTFNVDVDKYKDDIDFFRIDKISVKVVNFSGSNTPVFSGNLSFAAAGTTNFQAIGAVSNINLKTLYDTAGEVDIPINTEQVKQELINMMKAGNDITLKLEGSTSENPVVATLEIIVHANITVEI